MENSRAVRMAHRFSGKTVVRAAPQVRSDRRNVVRFVLHSFAGTDQGVQNAPHVMVWDRAFRKRTGDGWFLLAEPASPRMNTDAHGYGGKKSRLSAFASGAAGLMAFHP